MEIDTEFKTFADSCVFPDHPFRGQPRIRAPEHYVNLPRDSKGLTSDNCPKADKCVLTAILTDAKVLSSKGAADADRLFALKSLGHWVGDIHQPLHVSFEEDRGSFAISKAVRTGYCAMHGESCDMPSGSVTIGADYLDANGPVVKEQLQKAGVRLSRVLDTAFGN